jgi:hypothetical protein
MPGDIVDDKSEHCILFLLERLRIHREQHDTPFVLGLNGVQGAGKSTLVRSAIDYFDYFPSSVTCQTLFLELPIRVLLPHILPSVTCLSSAIPPSATCLTF